MIAIRTPLRVSFFGGGTDFRDYYKLGYGCVLSTTINQYIYLMINKKFDGKIQLNYRITEIVDSIDQIQHPTIREGMRLLEINEGIEISAIADVPSQGTGLGSSSSFIVGVLNGLYTYKNKQITAETLAQNSCKIEIDILKEPIGKQDQYIAAYGGFNLIKFNKNETVEIEPVNASTEILDELQNRLLFFYTGVHRKASDILTEQKNNIGKKIETLDKMRNMAEKMYSELSHNRIDEFGQMLNEAWQLKRSLATNISNNGIDNYYSKAIAAGARGGKILGGGGGGFFMFYCDKEKQDSVRKALADLREVHFKFEKDRSKIIYNDR